MPRNSNNIIQVASPSDKVLKALTTDLLADGSVTQAVVTFAPGSDEALKTVQEAEDFFKRYADLNQRTIRQVSFTIAGGSTCRFERGITASPQADYTIPSTYEAEFYFNNPPQSKENSARIAERIYQHCCKPEQIISIGSSPFQEAIGRHVASMADVADSVSQKLAEAQILYDQRLSEHQRKLTEQAEASENSRALRHTQQIEELEKLQSELEAKRAELDLRRARDARRTLRAEITENLKSRLQRPAASQSARLFRYMFIFVTTLAIVFAGFLVMDALLDLPSIASESTSAPLNVSIFYIGRLFVSTAVTFVLIFYLLGNLKRMEQEDTRYEQQLEKYSLDIDRASWVSETIIEYRDDEGGLDVPEAWLHGVTRNLFINEPAESTENQTSLEALGELLKAGARVKAGTDGAEVELDSRASKRVGKTKAT